MHVPIWKSPTHGIVVAKRSIPLFFNVNITTSTFLYKVWSASMKMKSVSVSFLIPCFSDFCYNKFVFCWCKVCKYPMVIWSKTSFETSLKNPLHKETLRFPIAIWTSALTSEFKYNSNGYISNVLQIHRVKPWITGDICSWNCS